MPSASVRHAERARRAAADQLEHVRVALLRHDRGAGGEGIRQLDEAELLRVEQQHVGGEAPEVLHEQRDLEQQLRFGLAARELHRRHRLLRRRRSRASRASRSRSSGSPGVP